MTEGNEQCGPRSTAPEDLALFREFAATRSRSVRNRLVERHIGLAVHIAKRFSRSGAIDEDVRQVAMLGLVKAVDRFDADHGAEFSAFAGVTIEGEIKRHFRDTSWTVKVPRSAKELYLLVRSASEELSKDGAKPSVSAIAAHLGIERDDVLRGLAATAAYSVGTLDVGVGDETELGHVRQRALAETETGFEHAENVKVLSEVIGRLPERQRQIVMMRLSSEASQSEIAEAMGISQMHVSRLLRKSFEQMREWMGDVKTE